VVGRQIAYLETTRGCPLRCTYCRYHHLRHGVDALTPGEVARRVRAFDALGFAEIRLIDPTFNAHPRFDDVLDALVDANRGRRLAFFAELRGDTITDRQAERLARANFTEIEVGLQSSDPRVLRAIRRATDLDALERGVRRLAGHGIRVTVDVMYGLPLQSAADVWRSIEWGRRIKGVRVQCMRTLLLPGTELREQARLWRLRAGRLPPYGVESTATLRAADLHVIEARLRASPDLPSDIRTPRFVAVRLPALFPERIDVDAGRLCADAQVPGASDRRALVFRGDDLFGCRETIAALVWRAVREEPDVLWQFVLACRHAEPLDLLDHLITAVRAAPPHLLDRYACDGPVGRMVARRVLVKLPAARGISGAWRAAAESLLREHFD
jgi:hypothetical protein